MNGSEDWRIQYSEKQLKEMEEKLNIDLRESIEILINACWGNEESYEKIINRLEK